MNACCETPAFKPPAAAPESALKTVVLIGPPNSGKSTLFNRLTGLRQKVANYPGVTVEQRMGLMAGVGREDLTLIDLPGIYSLTPYSEDARVAVDVLRGKNAGHAQAGRGAAGSGFAAPDAPTDAGRAGAGGGPAHAGAAQHERPDGGARRPHRRAQAGARAGRAGGPDQRRQRNRPGRRSALSQPANRPRQAAKPLTLPVVGNAASAHTWAAQVSRRTGYRAPLSVENTRKIDNILLHRIWGPLLFLRRRRRRL